MYKNLFLVILVIVLLSGCKINYDKKLIDTCWVIDTGYSYHKQDSEEDFYKTFDTSKIHINKPKGQKLPPLSKKKGGLIYCFYKDNIVIISNSVKTDYQLNKDKLIISGIKFEILDFSDTLIKTIQYSPYEPYEATNYINFKRINCNSIKK